MFGGQEVGVGDFVLLPEINMPNFVSNLRKRHAAGQIYTYIGEVCVNVNPYKDLGIYDDRTISQYKVINFKLKLCQIGRELLLFFE